MNGWLKKIVGLSLCLGLLCSCSDKPKVKANDIGDIGGVASAFDFRKETYYSLLDDYLAEQYPDVKFTRYNAAPFGGTENAGMYYVPSFDKARVYACWYVSNPDTGYPIQATCRTDDYTSDYNNARNFTNTYESSKEVGKLFKECAEMLPADSLIASNLVKNPGYIEVYTQTELTEEQLQEIIDANIGITEIYAVHSLSDTDYNGLIQNSCYYVSTPDWQLLYSPYSGRVSINMPFIENYTPIKVVVKTEQTTVTDTTVDTPVITTTPEMTTEQTDAITTVSNIPTTTTIDFWVLQEERFREAGLYD